MKVKMLVCLLAMSLLIVPMAMASENVYVHLLFNVGSVDEMTVTLYGESSVTTGVAPANVKFESTDGTDEWLNATVVGGSAQDASNPILTIDNTGTTDLQIDVVINATVAACQGLRYNTTWIADPSVTGNATAISTSNVTLNASLEPVDTPINLWLWGNFSGCLVGDATSRQLDIWGTAV